VTDPAAARAALAEAKDRFGRIDVLVNNAGTTRFIDHTDLEAVTGQVWDDIFSVNVRGAFQCVVIKRFYALPAFRRHGGK